jgi:hypothetical protein
MPGPGLAVRGAAGVIIMPVTARLVKIPGLRNTAQPMVHHG